MIKTLKYKLISWLAKGMLPMIEPKDVISFAKKGIEVIPFIDGEQLSHTEILGLKAEARFLEESRIWKLINSYFENLARKRIFEDSKDLTDLIFGKTTLYVLNIQKTIIKNINNAK
jgi:hypothetical protein